MNVIAIVLLYIAFLLMAWSGPSLLSLSRHTYGIMTAAHFVTFLVSVILFVLLGRSLKKRRLHRFWIGLWSGALVAVIGTGITQYIRHLPLAQNAFVSQLPGVPRQAGFTMLTLHAVTGAILAAAMFAVLFGLLGGIAAWWGGRQRRGSPTHGPTNPTEDPST